MNIRFPVVDADLNVKFGLLNTGCFKANLWTLYLLCSFVISVYNGSAHGECITRRRTDLFQLFHGSILV